MDNFSLIDLIIFGSIIYAFVRMIKKGINPDTKQQRRPQVRENQQNTDLMDFFKSAVDEIKNEMGSNANPEHSYDADDEDKTKELTRDEYDRSMYTERMTEPSALIRDPVRKSGTHKYERTEFREDSKEDPSFEYLKPGELLISDAQKREPSQMHEKLLNSLCDPHNLQHAILLREVLDPPVSKRKRSLHRL